MARHRDTDEGSEYSPAEEDALTDAIIGASRGHRKIREPVSITTTAQIEWAGTIDNNGRGGVRTTRLDGLNPRDMARLRQLAEKAEAAGRRAAEAAPLRSYRAKGWQAQLRALGRVKRGATAKDMAGLNVTRATMRAWETGKRAPSKANQARIRAAYDLARNPARMIAREASAEVARQFSDMLRARYGVNVRLREIQELRFH